MWDRSCFWITSFNRQIFVINNVLLRMGALHLWCLCCLKLSKQLICKLWLYVICHCYFFVMINTKSHFIVENLWKGGLRLNSTQIKIDPMWQVDNRWQARKLKLQKKNSFCDLYLDALIALMVNPWKGTKNQIIRLIISQFKFTTVYEIDQKQRRLNTITSKIP